VGSDPLTCGCASVDEADYRGTISETANGVECVRWGDWFEESFPDAGIVNNYCRNPDNKGRAWCWTSTTEQPTPSPLSGSPTKQPTITVEGIKVKKSDYTFGEPLLVEFNNTGGKNVTISIYPDDVDTTALVRTSRVGDDFPTSDTSGTANFTNIPSGSWIACMVEFTDIVEGNDTIGNVSNSENLSSSYDKSGKPEGIENTMSFGSKSGKSARSLSFRSSSITNTTKDNVNKTSPKTVRYFSPNALSSSDPFTILADFAAIISIQDEQNQNPSLIPIFVVLFGVIIIAVLTCMYLLGKRRKFKETMDDELEIEKEEDDKGHEDAEVDGGNENPREDDVENNSSSNEAPEIEHEETKEVEIKEGDEDVGVDEDVEDPANEDPDNEDPDNEDPEDDSDSYSHSVSSRSDSSRSNPCEVLLLDHFCMDYEKGRQDVLKAFYFDFLACAIDPRTKDNYDSEKKTLFANIGLNQFRLSEGTPDAQVFDGSITLVYEDLNVLMKRYCDFLLGAERFAPLKDTKFHVSLANGKMLVTEPWGNKFVLLLSNHPEECRAENLGAQPLIKGHALSGGLKLENITIYVKHGANFAGIGRFYEYVLGALVAHNSTTESSIIIVMGQQMLTFQCRPTNVDASEYTPDKKTVVGDELCHNDEEPHEPEKQIVSLEVTHVNRDLATMVPIAISDTSVGKGTITTARTITEVTTNEVRANPAECTTGEGTNADTTDLDEHDSDSKPNAASQQDEIKHDSIIKPTDEDDGSYNSDSSYEGYNHADEEFDDDVEEAVMDTLESGVEKVFTSLADGELDLEGALKKSLESAAEGAAQVTTGGIKKMMSKRKAKKITKKVLGESGLKASTALVDIVEGNLEEVLESVVEEVVEGSNDSGSGDEVDGMIEDLEVSSDSNSEEDLEVVCHPPNYRPHLSLFVTNLPQAYEMASNLGVEYVNTRFGRKAYTKKQAIAQSMFRFIDIVDPLDDNDKREVIVQLEHKVRSTRTKNGKKYTSFPFVKKQD